MADITVTTTQVALIDPAQAEVYDFERAESLALGQAVFVDSNGKLQQADANVSGEEEFAGIVIFRQGRGLSVLKRGRAYGYTVSGMAYWDPVYLSDTAGALSTTPGTNKVYVGRVVPISDADKTKVIYIDAVWGGQPPIERPGFIPLDLASAREIFTNDIGVAAVAAAQGSGGLLATDTTPALERINGATDKGLRVRWAAANVDAIQFAPIPLPPDLDDGRAITVHFYAEMGGATDTPTLAVAAFFNVGDSNAGGATGALADAVGEVSVSIAAGDVPAHPGVLNIEVTPGAHGTDALDLYVAWLEYTKLG